MYLQLPAIAGDRQILSECNLYTRLIGVENHHFCELLLWVYAIFRLWTRAAEKRLDVRFQPKYYNKNTRVRFVRGLESISGFVYSTKK